jgi:FKBP-type peptidyl-prolyl cis-trans isomerase FkpA
MNLIKTNIFLSVKFIWTKVPIFDFIINSRLKSAVNQYFAVILALAQSHLPFTEKNLKKYTLFVLMLVLTLQSCKDKKPVISEKDRQENAGKFIEINRILIKKDKQRIIGYIERNNLHMTETGTGLWYVIEKQGEGEYAVKGKTATINYSVSLLDGTLCYTSKNEGSKTFRIGMGGLESGIEEGILLMKTRGMAKFILPPHLAHGLPGDGNKIPARAILVYEVELLSLQ